MIIPTVVETTCRKCAGPLKLHGEIRGSKDGISIAVIAEVKCCKTPTYTNEEFFFKVAVVANAEC